MNQRADISINMNPTLSNPTVPVCLWSVGAELGEGALWHAPTKRVYFVDIKGRQIHACAPDGTQQQSWAAPSQVGFIVPRAGSGFICGLEDGLYLFSEVTGAFSLLQEVEQNLPGNRLNDGFVDAHGRLWFGSMDNGETQPSGVLYCRDQQGTITVQDRDYIITNGPAMSPDGTILYHTDTLKKQVFAFDVAIDGSLANKRVFIDMQSQSNGKGHPDGMAVDSLGYVWVALFGGARIDRYAPTGTLVEQIAFPCSNITKLCFGGDDLCTLFVTTAWKGLLPAARQLQPLAGGLFSFRCSVPGLAQTVCSTGAHA